MKYRPTGLFVLAMALIFVMLSLVYLLGAVVFYESAKADDAPEVTQRVSMPQRCAELLDDPDPDTWNPVTETYPINREWRICMAVEAVQ